MPPPRRGLTPAARGRAAPPGGGGPTPPPPPPFPPRSQLEQLTPELTTFSGVPKAQWTVLSSLGVTPAPRLAAALVCCLGPRRSVMII
jgi:hypothetical protein